MAASRDEVRHVLACYVIARWGERGETQPDGIHGPPVEEAYAELNDLISPMGWTITWLDQEHYMVAIHPDGPSGKRGDFITQPEFSYGSVLVPL